MEVIYNDITKCIEYRKVTRYFMCGEPPYPANAISEDIVELILEPYPESHHLE